MNSLVVVGWVLTCIGGVEVEAVIFCILVKVAIIEFVETPFGIIIFNGHF